MGEMRFTDTPQFIHGFFVPIEKCAQKSQCGTFTLVVSSARHTRAFVINLKRHLCC